ncbi:MAG: type II toxin-antitoxin system HigB family toxin [Blastocatellia bacterium]
MKVLSKRALREFWELHADAQAPLMHWYNTTIAASWRSLADVRRSFANADQVGKCVVFNIHGNDYRLITKIKFERQIVYIRFVLTHSEYDQGRWKNDCGK